MLGLISMDVMYFGPKDVFGGMVSPFHIKVKEAVLSHSHSEHIYIIATTIFSMKVIIMENLLFNFSIYELSTLGFV